MSHYHQSHQPTPDVDQTALVEGHLWAAKMMEDIPRGALAATLTRNEYHDLLVLAFAMGFKQGRKPLN